MKKSATALVSLVLVVFMAPPALAAPLLESSSGVALSRVPVAVEPGEDYSSGAVIRDYPCYSNQLSQGTLGGARVELPFLMRMNHTDWDHLWVTVPGTLAFESQGVPFGQDFETNDLVWSYEIIAPMMGANSGWDTTDEGASVTPTYYGFTTYEDHRALCVTWLDVAPEMPVGEPYFEVANPDTGYGFWYSEWGYDYSKRNSFQVLIVDRNDTGTGNFDIVYNYDSIQWQTYSDYMDSMTGEYDQEYAQAGWSMGIGISPCDSSTCWKGTVDGRVNDIGQITFNPQLPYPEEHWFPQAANGEYTTYLDSSPTGLAVTSTNSTQVGRHIFEIRNPRWHLALVLDGSASVTPEEFASEIEAIATGLDDETAFPRDGRFGVSVTVSGDFLDPATGDPVDSLVVIPERKLNSEAAIASLQNRLRSILQATNAGGSDLDAAGLSTAVNDLNAFPQRDSLQSVCQVTFARPSTALTSELSSDRASNLVDRVDLIGIGGHGNTGYSQQERNARAKVFGGTGYKYVPSTAELAEEWVGHCTKRLPLIRGIEVNQSVQNLENDVPLIAGRNTIVRVYVEKTFSDAPFEQITGTLTARSGVYPFAELPGSPREPVRSGWVTLTSDFTKVRGDGNKVLEFSIPQNWTEGDVVLSLNTNKSGSGASALLPGVTCTWATDYPCGVETTFAEVEPLSLRVFSINIDGVGPTDDDIVNQIDQLVSQFPVADMRGFGYDLVPVSLDRDEMGSNEHVLNYLQWRRSLEAGISQQEEKTYYHAFVKDFHGGGLSTTGYAVSMNDVTGIYRNAFVHEMGHAVGLRHALAEPIEISAGGTLWGLNPNNQVWTGYCGAEIGSQAPKAHWIHFAQLAASPAIKIPTMSDFAAPGVLSPGGKVKYTSATPTDVFNEYWGVDTSKVGNDPRLAYSNPRYTGELMSYVNGNNCHIFELKGGKEVKNQGIWMSPESYTYVLNHLVPEGTSYEAADSALVMGSMSADEEGVQVEFEPVRDVLYSDFDRTNDFGFVLDLYDASGVKIGTVSPEVLVSTSDSVEGSTEDGEGGSDLGVFVANFVQQDVARIDLVSSAGEVLGSTTATPATPMIEITSPVEGSSISGDEVVLEWEASDADGDLLEFDVLYSPDGVDWNTLEMGITGDSVAIDRSQIAGSSTGEFMVIVNDGFNSSSSTVGNLEVAGNAPWVVTSKPVDGEQYWASLPIPFEVYTYDREDGVLPASDTVWESDLDGVIDTSQDVRASDFTEGVHVITATVTDSDGNTASASSTIEILAEEPPDTIEWTVAFDSQGGSEVDGVVVTDGDAITQPADPTRPGYTFEGWFTASTGGEVWDFATATVEADMTLYAQWSIIEWTVAFDSQGGGDIGDLTINDGELVVRPPDPSRVDYTFDGWFTVATGGEAWDFGSATVNADVTL